MQDNTRIKLCVGGRIFETTYKVLKRSKFFEDYFIQFTEEYFSNFDTNREIMVNQSADAFEHILRYMEDPFYEVPENFKQDMRYYCIKGDSNDYEENKELHLEKRQKIVLMQKNFMESRDKIINIYIEDFKKKHKYIYILATEYPLLHYQIVVSGPFGQSGQSFGISGPFGQSGQSSIIIGQSGQSSGIIGMAGPRITLASQMAGGTRITNFTPFTPITPITQITPITTITTPANSSITNPLLNYGLFASYYSLDTSHGIRDINDYTIIQDLFIHSYHFTVESADNVLTDSINRRNISREINSLNQYDVYFPNDIVKYKIDNIDFVKNTKEFMNFLYKNDPDFYHLVSI